MQTKVNSYQSVAVAGDRASLNPVIYTPQNYLAGEGGVTVGGFVWEAGDEANPEGVISSGTGVPLGFVERTLSNFYYNASEEGTLQIAEGGLVPVAVLGDFWVAAPAAVEKGQPVYADPSTGAVSFTETSCTTPYVTVTAAEEGELVCISAYSGLVSLIANVAASGGSIDLSQYMTKDFANATGALGIANGGTGLTAVGTDGQVLTSDGSALEYRTPATTDTSDFVTEEALATELESYAKTEDLDDYAKTSDLSAYATTASLASYVTSSSLTTTLADYAKSEDLGALATAESVNLASQVTGTLPLANGGTAATSASAARTSLGLGSVATLSSIDLTSNVTGTLPTANGGTGNTTGNAATATKLATARTISLTGDVTGSASFDGSANVSIATTAASTEDGGEDA